MVRDGGSMEEVETGEDVLVEKLDRIGLIVNTAFLKLAHLESSDLVEEGLLAEDEAIKSVCEKTLARIKEVLNNEETAR